MPLEEISIIANTKFSLLEKSSVKVLPILKNLESRMAYEDTKDGMRSSKKGSFDSGRSDVKKA
jgi:hypothetical protein